LKTEKPHWGARKIRELLVRRLDGDVKIPAKSTIHAVLDRRGLVKRGGGPRHRARGTPLSPRTAPNDLWCADFKGEFKLGNGRCCYPLTVTDHASRFLLLCEALDSTRKEPAITAFERLFRERGLPLAMRSDLLTTVIPPSRLRKNVGGGSIPAHSKSTGPDGRPFSLSKDTIAIIQSKSIRFQVFGFIEYHDEFSWLGKPSRTGFCYIYNPDGTPASYFDPCPEKNYTYAH
jgi:hypothetical protein